MSGQKKKDGSLPPLFTNQKNTTPVDARLLVINFETGEATEYYPDGTVKVVKTDLHKFKQ